MKNARRRRLLAYFNGPLRGDREVLIRRSGLTKGRVSQLFDEKEPFGEIAARNLASRLGLPDDYFEHDSPQAGVVAEPRVEYVTSATESRREFLFGDPGSSTVELGLRTMDRRRSAGKVDLAVMDVRASMGQGIEQPARENVVMSMVVDETWLRRHANFSHPDNLGILTGIGDSMQPTFEDGDPLLVDRTVTDVKLDAVYVLSLNDRLYIKRLQQRPDGAFVMISDNKKYDSYVITDAERDKLEVLGRVVMVWNARKI